MGMKTLHVVFVMVLSTLAVFANEKYTLRSQIPSATNSEMMTVCKKNATKNALVGQQNCDSLQVETPDEWYKENFKYNCLIDSQLYLQKDWQSNASVVLKKTRFQKMQKADFEQWLSSNGSVLNSPLNQQYMALYKNCSVSFPHHANLLFWYDYYQYRPPTDCEKIYNFQYLRKDIYIIPPIVQGFLSGFLQGVKEDKGYGNSLPNAPK